MTAAVTPIRPLAEPEREATDAPPLSPARALTVRAFFALIDRALETRDEFLPGDAARRLILQVKDADLGDIDSTADTLRFSLCGITATTTGGAIAALREWQRIAGIRLARGSRP